MFIYLYPSILLCFSLLSYQLYQLLPIALFASICSPARERCNPGQFMHYHRERREERECKREKEKERRHHPYPLASVDTRPFSIVELLGVWPRHYTSHFQRTRLSRTFCAPCRSSMYFGACRFQSRSSSLSFCSRSFTILSQLLFLFCFPSAQYSQSGHKHAAYPFPFFQS